MDRTVKGLLAQMALHQRSQTVVTLAQIDHFGGELNDYRLTPVGSLFECNSRY